MGSEKQQIRRNVSMDNVDEKRSSIDIAAKPTTRAARDREIRDAVERKDWDRLVEMSAQPGGFQGARTVAWPFLLHVDTTKTEPGPDMKEELDTEDELPLPSAKPPPTPHRDERQVGLDTNRAFVHYPVESQQRKDKRKKQLTDLIMGVLNRRPQLSYFQGYHDILSTLQLTLHPSVETNEEAFRLLQECAVKISLHRARDAMGSGLEPLTGQLRILRRLIRVADPELALLIEEAAPLPYWAISPLMTLYTHDLPTLALAQRVMDWILARPPDAVIYLVAAFTLKRKEGVQKLIDEGDDGMMHSFLCSLPELEADEPEWDEEQIPPSQRDSPSTPTPTETASYVTSIASDTTEDNSPKTPVSPTTEPPPYSEQDSFDKSRSDQHSRAQSHDATPNSEKQAIDPAPPSPASSLSSLPPQDPVMDDRHEVTVPLSQVLREADRLRQRYPIHDKRLRLDETLGPKSMIRTWSSNPNDILGDDAAEEAVIATDQIVLPDLDDDVFDPYPPPTKPADTRLALLPKLDMRLALSVGIPVIAMGLAFASRSPTARAHAQDVTAWAYAFIEVGGGMV